MNILGWLTGATVESAGKAVNETLNGIGDSAIKIRTALKGAELSPDKAAEVEILLTQMDNAILLSQNELNKLDAQSGSLFKGGWRPAIGWICAASIGLYYIPRFVLGMILWVRVAWGAPYELPPMPEMGIQDILGLVASMLGLAVLRSADKSKRITN